MEYEKKIQENLLLAVAMIYSISQQMNIDEYCKSIARAFEAFPELEQNDVRNQL